MRDVAGVVGGSEKAHLEDNEKKPSGGLASREWRAIYRSGDQNILRDFYEPALSLACTYDRAVGFFSAGILSAALVGLRGFVRNGGRMRLVLGAPLSKEEYQAVTSDTSGVFAKRKLEELWEQLEDHAAGKHEAASLGAKVLGYLVKAGHAEIRFALRDHGMYHEKIGIIRDASQNTIVFSGSANETVYGLDPEYNAESITVYKSWQREIFNEYGPEFIDGFEVLWAGKQRNTLTLELHSALYQRIAARAVDEDLLPVIDDSYSSRADQFAISQILQTEPCIPQKLGDRKFELGEHQRAAIRSWQENEFSGVLKLSTGSGKTITAIVASVKIFEQRRDSGRSTVLIVAVPYIELAEQWSDILGQFSIFPVKVWGGKGTWEAQLRRQISDHNLQQEPSFMAILVVNKSLCGDEFRDLVDMLNFREIIFVGDECHNHGSAVYSEALPNAAYKLGLSATPYRSDDEEVDSPFPDLAKDRITKYYGSIVHEFSLQDAIDHEILCPYEYRIVAVNLTEEEQSVYDEISGEIGKILATRGNGPLSPEKQTAMNIQTGKRARLLGSLSGKLSALRSLASKIRPEERRKTLVYCGEGRGINDEGEAGDDKTIELVSRIFGEAGWKTSRFTSDESPSERRNIMGAFRDNDIDALVAMKVLDEGVDVPECRTAIITASTRNERQFVQRRGRVLRKAAGKSHAVIYDFVAKPHPSANRAYSAALAEAELARVDDFCSAAMNKAEVENMVDEMGLRDD